MADLEAELARFEAELASSQPSGPSPMGPPMLRPPTLSPPVLQPPRGPPPGHLPQPSLPPPGMGAHPHHGPPRVMLPQHAGQHGAPHHGPGMMGGPPPQMMPPPMMPPPMMQPPMIPPPQQYGGAGPSMYGGPAVYAAPPAHMAPPAGPSGGGASAAAGGAAADTQKQKGQKKVAIVRKAAGERWADPTLLDWPENDFRIFVGNLGNEVTDALLTASFNKYASFTKAKVVRFSHNNKTKGYGFVSLSDNIEGVRCLREMQGKYIGNRPIQVKRSNWDERNVVDRKTGKAKKREITIKEKSNPNKRHASGEHHPGGGRGDRGGGGFLHR